MGRQVNFYMTLEDEAGFLDCVRSSDDVAVISSRQSSGKIIELDEMPAQGEPFWFSLCFWNRDISVQPALRYISEQRHYSVDRLNAEVIEFQRCGTEDLRLTRGRIWAEMRFLYTVDGAHALGEKSEAFLKWYERIARWIKRNSVRNESGYYVFPGAQAVLEQGGQLA